MTVTGSARTSKGTTWIARVALAASGMFGVIAMSSDSKGRGPVPPEDRWAPAHIEGLPTEIRRSLARYQPACGVLAAEHYFAIHLDSSPWLKFIALHFERFRCDKRTALCSDKGCLHQVFVSTGGAYRHIFSAYTPELELKLVNNTSPAIEIGCGHLVAECKRIQRWNGARFVGR